MTSAGAAGALANTLVSIAYRAAGADHSLLDRGPAWTERYRFACLGTMMLLVGGLNGGAVWAALHLIFKPATTGSPTQTLLAGSIAVMWTLIVLNMNRFAMSSLPAGDGRHGISVHEVVGGALRILSAAIMALVVSVPATIVLLHADIRDQITPAQLANITEIQRSAEMRFQERLEPLYTARVEASAAHLEALSGVARLEALVRASPASMNARWQEDLERARREVAGHAARRDRANERIRELREELAAEKRHARDNAAAADGLWTEAERMLDAGPAVYAWVVSLLLLMQVGPVLLGILSARGPYEHAVELQDEITCARHGIRREAERLTDSRGTEHRFDQFLAARRILSSGIANLRDHQQRSATRRLERTAAARQAILEGDWPNVQG